MADHHGRVTPEVCDRGQLLLRLCLARLRDGQPHRRLVAVIVGVEHAAAERMKQDRAPRHHHRGEGRDGAHLPGRLAVGYHHARAHEFFDVSLRPVVPVVDPGPAYAVGDERREERVGDILGQTDLVDPQAVPRREHASPGELRALVELDPTVVAQRVQQIGHRLPKPRARRFRCA